MYHDKATIYERATYLEAVRLATATRCRLATARELRSKYACLSTCVYTDKGDASTWNEFYADLIKEVCDD